jgi:hypothetical protein
MADNKFGKVLEQILSRKEYFGSGKIRGAQLCPKFDFLNLEEGNLRLGST